MSTISFTNLFKVDKIVVTLNRVILMMYFGNRLKALRLAKNLTQQQLAYKIGLVKGSISAYEQSAKYPSIEILIKLCNLFNVSADYLLGLSDCMESKMSTLTDEQVQIIMRLIAEFEQYNNLRDKFKE